MTGVEEQRALPFARLETDTFRLFMVSERTPDTAELEGKEDKPREAACDTCAAGTDPGCEREANEDRYLVTRAVCGSGYFVFDGMGGAPGGAAAAEVSSEAINDFFRHSESSDVETAMRASIEYAQGRLLEARTAPGRTNMGTTVVGACVNGTNVAIGAVGDSRAYHISDGCIRQLTSDHTIVQQLVDAGHLSPQDALMHPQSHVLTRCLGSEISFKIDCLRFWLWPTRLGQRGDTLLLCSDGLYSLVSDQEICEIVCNLGADDAVAKLIQLARERGGFDNITVLIKPLDGLLRDKPRREVDEGLGSRDRFTQSVAPPESDVVSPQAAKARARGAKSLRRGNVNHLKNMLLLGGLAGFAAILSFAVLMMLRG